MEHKNSKGSFNSTFGFLMAAIGSAVGLGNLWGFPYKMGMSGGFAFLIIYLVLTLFVGYPLLVGEIAMGRKTGKGAIEAYRAVDSRFTINGWFEAVVPFFLLCFYCTFGGYIIKYMVANLGDIFGASWGTGRGDANDFFGTFITSGGHAIVFSVLFVLLTAFIIFSGVEGGIEKFSNLAMPALFVMLLVIVVRSCTLPGAVEGLKFMFKPDFSVFSGLGWLNILGLAGSQMFFSLSLAAGCLIAYGSYLSKESNIERNSLLIPIADTTVAILAGMAVLPAVFAYGIEPTSGPSLLFVSLQAVFNGMGSAGPIFGFIFYLLVFFSALTSSVGMMEGGVSAFMDRQVAKGKEHNRTTVTLFFSFVALAGSTLVTTDALGSAGLWHPFGQSTWLDVFDLIGEGILMPLGGLLMAIMFGWFRRGYITDEVKLGSNYRSQPFVDFCMRYIAPVFLVFIVFVQLNAFFHFTTLF